MVKRVDCGALSTREWNLLTWEISRVNMLMILNTFVSEASAPLAEIPQRSQRAVEGINRMTRKIVYCGV